MPTLWRAAVTLIEDDLLAALKELQLVIPNGQFPLESDLERYHRAI